MSEKVNKQDINTPGYGSKNPWYYEAYKVGSETQTRVDFLYTFLCPITRVSNYNYGKSKKELVDGKGRKKDERTAGEKFCRTKTVVEDFKTRLMSDDLNHIRKNKLNTDKDSDIPYKKLKINGEAVEEILKRTTKVLSANKDYKSTITDNDYDYARNINKSCKAKKMFDFFFGSDAELNEKKELLLDYFACVTEKLYYGCEEVLQIKRTETEVGLPELLRENCNSPRQIVAADIFFKFLNGAYESYKLGEKSESDIKQRAEIVEKLTGYRYPRNNIINTDVLFDIADNLELYSPNPERINHLDKLFEKYILQPGNTDDKSMKAVEKFSDYISGLQTQYRKTNATLYEQLGKMDTKYLKWIETNRK